MSAVDDLKVFHKLRNRQESINKHSYIIRNKRNVMLAFLDDALMYINQNGRCLDSHQCWFHTGDLTRNPISKDWTDNDLNFVMENHLNYSPLEEIMAKYTFESLNMNYFSKKFLFDIESFHDNSGFWRSNNKHTTLRGRVELNRLKANIANGVYDD